MSLIKAFADFLQDEIGIGTIGDDLYISRAPTGVDIDNKIWWLTLQNAGQSIKNATGEWSQTSNIYIYCRSIDASEVFDSLESLNTQLIEAGCFQLVGYTIKEGVNTIGPFADLDLDNEERTLGVLQVSLTTYK